MGKGNKFFQKTGYAYYHRKKSYTRTFFYLPLKTFLVLMQDTLTSDKRVWPHRASCRSRLKVNGFNYRILGKFLYIIKAICVPKKIIRSFQIKSPVFSGYLKSYETLATASLKVFALRFRNTLNGNYDKYQENP